jgi:outer membrane protein assembly factor BamB
MKLRPVLLASLLLVPCCVLAAAVAEEPDLETRAKIEGYVKLLGGDDAKTRDEAVKALVAMGDVVRPIVETALADASVEVRARARNVLALLDDAAKSHTAADQTWPGLRGGASRSGVADGELPKTMPKLAWTTELYEKSLIQGAVVPAGGYVACLSGTGTVRAFSSKDGGRLWVTDLAGGITASAVLAGERLVVPTGKGLVALDAKDGHVAWQFEAPYGSDAAPAIVGRRVYAAFRNLGVKAFDLATGEELFTKALVPAGALLADADLLVCGTQDGALLRIDVETGRVRWKNELGAAPNMGPTLAAPGIVIAFTKDRYLRAFRTEDGKELWRRRETWCSGSESLGAAAGRVFLTDKGGWISAFDAASGKLLWKRNEGFVEMGGPCATATAVICASRGRLVCRDADCGDYLWRLDIAAKDNAAPSAAAGRIYVLYDKELRCYE